MGLFSWQFLRHAVRFAACAKYRPDSSRLLRIRCHCSRRSCPMHLERSLRWVFTRHRKPPASSPNRSTTPARDNSLCQRRQPAPRLQPNSGARRIRWLLPQRRDDLRVVRTCVNITLPTRRLSLRWLGSYVSTRTAPNHARAHARSTLNVAPGSGSAHD